MLRGYIACDNRVPTDDSHSSPDLTLSIAHPAHEDRTAAAFAVATLLRH